MIAFGLLGVAAALATSVPAAGDATAWPDVPRYVLTVTVGRGTIAVDGTLTFTRVTASGDEELVLNDRMSDLHAAVVGAGGAETAVPVTSDAPKDGQTRWHVRVPAGASPSMLTLHVRYTGMGDARLVYSIGDRIAFAAGVDSAWYPQRGDQSRGLGTLRYIVPSGIVVESSGRETTTADDRAAGAVAFAHDVPTSFAFAAAPYAVVVGAKGGTQVSGYFLRPRANARDYLERCARVLTFLEHEFGPLRYAKFAVVEVPDAQALEAGFSGASVEGAIYVTTSFLDAPFNTAFYGHEISHQWWGNLIRLRGNIGRGMLDEAMAQFGSLQAVRTLDGDAAAERYRREGYPGYIATQSAQGYFELAAAGLDHPLDDLAHAPSGTAHTLSDSKGFLVLDLLARTVGRDRFRANLMALTAVRAFEAVSWPEFERAVTAGSSADVERFSNQWLRRPGAPAFALSWRQNGTRIDGVVTQDAPAYDVDAELVLRGSPLDTVSHTIHLRGARTAFSLTAPPFHVVTAELDPSFDVLHWTPAMRARAVAKSDVTRGIFAYAGGDVPGATRAFERALTVPRPRDEYYVRFTAQYYLARFAQRRGDAEAARRNFRAALAEPARDATLLPNAYLHLAEAAAKLGDAAEARTAAEAALQADIAIGGTAGIETAAKAVLAGLQR